MSVQHMNPSLSSTIISPSTHDNEKTDAVEYSIPSKGTEHYDDYVSYKTLQCHDCYYAAHCDRHRH